MWLLLFLAVFWFLYMAVVPGGKITYIYDFEKHSEFISKLSPDTRVIEADKEYPNFIIGNPVYFNLHTSRKFTSAELEIKYRRLNDFSIASDYPVFEAGILLDGKHWRYDLQPLENEILDKLSLVWNLKSEGDLLLLQNPRQDASSSDTLYDSIQDFLENPPTPEKIAVYNFDLDYEYVLENYRSLSVEELLDSKEESYVEIEKSLRGAYQFYTYIKNEDLDFRFTVFDRNENKDADQVEIFFYYDNHLIASSRLEDDGITSDQGEQSGERELELKIPNLPEGVYKLEFKANDDIVTRKITSRQKKIAFINRLYFDEGESDEIRLFTDSSVIEATAPFVDGLQKIKIGNDELNLTEAFKQYSLIPEITEAKSVFREVLLERGSVILSGNRLFSLSPDAFFNPDPKRIDKYLNIAAEGVAYVLADYKRPLELEDGWRIATGSFNLANAYREDLQYGFILSVPGLKSPIEPSVDDFGIEIDSIKVNLQGIKLRDKMTLSFRKE